MGAALLKLPCDRWSREKNCLFIISLRPVYTCNFYCDLGVIFCFWWMWTTGWVVNVQMRVHILRTFITHLLSHIRQKKNIALEIAYMTIGTFHIWDRGYDSRYGLMWIYNTLPKVVGFLRVLQFPPTGKGWVRINTVRKVISQLL